MTEVYSFRCGCCGISGFQANRPFVEVDLGLVCDPCRGRLRIATTLLKREGFRVCSHAADVNERRALVPVKRGGTR